MLSDISGTSTVIFEPCIISISTSLTLNTSTTLSATSTSDQSVSYSTITSLSIDDPGTHTTTWPETLSAETTISTNFTTTSIYHFGDPLPSVNSSLTPSISMHTSRQMSGDPGSSPSTSNANTYNLDTDESFIVPGVGIAFIAIGATILFAALIVLSVYCWKSRTLTQKKRKARAAQEGPPLLAQAMAAQQAERRIWYGNFYGNSRRPGAELPRVDRQQQLRTGNFYGRDKKAKLEQVEEID